MELTDRRGRAADAARWDHRRNAGVIRQAGIQEELRLVEFVTEGPGNVPDRSLEVLLCEPCVGYHLQITVAFHEDPPGAVHHDFRGLGIEDQTLDGAEKRQVDSKPMGRLPRFVRGDQLLKAESSLWIVQQSALPNDIGQASWVLEVRACLGDGERLSGCEVMRLGHKDSEAQVYLCRHHVRSSLRRGGRRS